MKPDSRALVTGAASGLGLALVQQLSGRGLRVLATDVRSEMPAELAILGGVVYRPLDVTSDVDWSTARDWVTEHWGGIDYVFNNAGVAAGGRIELTEMDQWQWIVDINLLGVARGCRFFTPMMKQQRNGHLINTASAAGLIHPPRMSEYNAVKAGVVALSETLMHELKPWDVKVSVVCPTFFKTNLTQSLRGKDESSREAATSLIDKSKTTAEEIAVALLKDVERGKHIIIPNRDGRMAYRAKRFARPLYYRAMHKASQQMSGKD